MLLKSLYYNKKILNARTLNIKIHDANVLQDTYISSPEHYILYPHNASIAVDPTYNTCHLIYGVKLNEDDAYQDRPLTEEFKCYLRTRNIAEYEDCSIIGYIKHNNITQTIISTAHIPNSSTENGIWMHPDFEKVIATNNKDTLYNAHNLIWNDCSFSMPSKYDSTKSTYNSTLWDTIKKCYSMPYNIIEYSFDEENKDLSIDNYNCKNTPANLSNIFQNCNIDNDISIYIKADSSSLNADYAFCDNYNLNKVYIDNYKDPSFNNTDDNEKLQIIRYRNLDIDNLIIKYKLNLEDNIRINLYDGSLKYIDNTNHMFYNNYNLTMIDVSVLIKPSDDMSYMFADNPNLRTIKINFSESIPDNNGTTGVDMSYFMQNCTNINNVYLGKTKPVIYASNLKYAFNNTARYYGGPLSIPLTINMLLLSPEKCYDTFTNSYVDVSLLNLPPGDWDFTNSSFIGGIDNFSEGSIIGLINTLRYDPSGNSNICIPSKFNYLEGSLRQLCSNKRWTLKFS